MGTPPDALLRLVDRSSQDHKVFLSPDYRESQLPEVKTPHEQESLKRTIAATDKQIDALVYELYGLTEEEVGIVEGAAK